jgi:hypothetical protein
MAEFNGKGFICDLSEQCREHQVEVKEALKKFNEVYFTVGHMSKSLSHLSKLDIMVSLLEGIQDNLNALRNNLIPAATGVDRMPIKSVDQLLEDQRKGAALVYKMLGAIIIVLLFVLGHLLVGENLGWIKTLL